MSYPHNSAPAPVLSPIQSIALDVAQLCLDCNMITAANNNHCRVCGSHSVLMLAKVLGK